MAKADYDYWILETLDSQGGTWLREFLKSLRRREIRFRNTWLKERLDLLVKDGFLFKFEKSKEIESGSKKPGRPRTYYAITDKGKAKLHFERHRLEREEEVSNTLEKHWREGSELEWERLHNMLKKPLKEQFRLCFNRVNEIEGLRTRSFHNKIFFNTKRYRGSITIEWSLTPPEMERRNKLFEKAMRKEGKPIPILKEAESLEDGSYPAIEIGYKTPEGKVVLFKKQPKELVESLKAREIVIDKHAKPQEAPIPEFSKQMKARVEKVRKALYGYSRNEKGEIERSR